MGAHSQKAETTEFDLGWIQSCEKLRAAAKLLAVKTQLFTVSELAWLPLPQRVDNISIDAGPTSSECNPVGVRGIGGSGWGEDPTQQSRSDGRVQQLGKRQCWSHLRVALKHGLDPTDLGSRDAH